MANVLPTSSCSPMYGKAVSSKNITIAAKKILDDYLSESLDKDDRKVHSPPPQSKISDEVHSINVLRKRLDRLDRSTVIQDACLYDDMEADSFKQNCRQLNIPAVTYTYLLNALRRNESTLNLSNHGIGPNGALAIKNELVESAKRIVEIDISSNNLCDQGTAAMCQYLAKNDSVMKVNFSRNALRKAGVDAIAHMLPRNGSLKYLVLSHNDLTEDDFGNMAGVLHTETVLETLDLSSNSFSPRSGYLFGFLVAQNVSLVNINISCNHIGDEGIRNLIPGLIQNRTIRSLDISWNDIGDEGAIWLAELLISNSILRNLNLSYNHISGKGVKHIAKSLAINVALRLLELSGNSLVSEDSVIMLEAMLRNPSTKMKQLCLREVIISTKFESLYKQLRSIHPSFIVSGMVSAAGQPIKMTSANKVMEVLEEYFENNKLDPYVSYSFFE